MLLVNKFSANIILLLSLWFDTFLQIFRRGYFNANTRVDSKDASIKLLINEWILIFV